MCCSHFWCIDWLIKVPVAECCSLCWDLGKYQCCVLPAPVGGYRLLCPEQCVLIGIALLLKAFVPGDDPQLSGLISAGWLVSTLLRPCPFREDWLYLHSTAIGPEFLLDFVCMG